MSGAVFDVGGLIALDRNDRRVLALLARAAELGARITVPASALAQAVATQLNKVRLSRLLRQPRITIVPLDGPNATQVGLLLAASSTADIADAHVVICARGHGKPVLTSDPGDLKRLDPRALRVVI